MKSSLPGLLIVLGALGLGLWTLVPPQPKAADAPMDEFSAGRALEVVEAVARAPHPVGSREHERVREELVRRLRALGLETRLQRTLVVFDHPRREETRVRAAWLVNVLARLPGRTPAPAIALMSHYDSVPTGPGAADDASGVATSLEAVRALVASGEPLARGVMLVITDGEEIGLMGAQAFFREDPWAADIGLLLNLEARGAAGPPFMFQSSPGNAALISALARTAPYPVASSMSMEVYERMPNDTDATIARAAGVPFLNFAFVDDFYRYHAASDTPAHLSLRSLQHEGSAALALVRDLAGRATLPQASGDATYFNLSPHLLVRYPLWMVWTVGVLAFFTALWALRSGFRHRRLRLASLSGGVLFAIAGWVGAFWGIQGLFGLLSTSHRPFALFYRYHLLVVAFTLLTLAFLAGLWSTRSAVRRWTAAGVALLTLPEMALAPAIGPGALSAVALLGLCAVRPRWMSADGITAFHLVIWMMLLVATLVFAPHASFLFAWPLALGGGALVRLWRREGDSPVAALVLAPAVVLWSSVLYTVYLALGVQKPGMVMALMALVLGLGALWLRQTVGPRGAAATAAIGLAIVFLARIRDPYSPDLPRPSELFYALDSNAGEAFWASRDPVSSSWATTLLGREPLALAESRFFPHQQGSWRGAPAPVLDLPGVSVEPLERETTGDGWHLAIRVRSARLTERVRLTLPPGAYEEGSLDGHAVPLPAEDEPWRWDLWGLPEEGAVVTLSGAGEPPREVRWTRIDYDVSDPVRQLIPRSPDDLMPTVWGLSDSAVVAGSADLSPTAPAAGEPADSPGASSAPE